MTFDRVRKLADAVLFEGYVLYPYRASSSKNRFRWSFGVLAPRSWSEADGCEPWWMETQLLIAPSGTPRVTGRLRCLQTQARRVEAAAESEPRFRPVDKLEVDGTLHLPWEEGLLREIDFTPSLEPGEQVIPFGLSGGLDTEPVLDAQGVPRGRVLRERWKVSGQLHIRVDRMEAERPLLRLTIRVENETPWRALDVSREEALRAACLATHLMFAIEGGEFLSLIDPPAWAEAAARACKSTRGFPVLAGEPGRSDLVLASPIILYDHPQVAPESPGDFFDATEIDELLTLRTLTLTDEEQREARATDPRSAAILDRVHGLPPEQLDRLHGAIRELHRAEMVPRRVPRGLTPGQRVRLKPGNRRTDAQDLLFHGRLATVEAVLRDVDDREYLAVTIDGDPAAELNRWHGRFHYYQLDEVEPVAEPGEATS